MNDHRFSEAIILCGGLGTRLRDVVSDRPKVMVDISGRPFLEILLDFLKRQGVNRYILCTGYKGMTIEKYFKEFNNPNIMISQEDKPLGTAGALKRCEPLLQSDPVLVMNGDSFCPLDLAGLWTAHLSHTTLMTMALISRQGHAEGGVVDLDSHQKVVSFSEKPDGADGGYFNAGIYVMSREILQSIPDAEPFSLEHEFIPGLVGRGVYGYVASEILYDLGTPQRLERFRWACSQGQIAV